MTLKTTNSLIYEFLLSEQLLIEYRQHFIKVKSRIFDYKMDQSINVTNNDISLALDTIYAATLLPCIVNETSALACKLGAYVTANDLTRYVSLDNTAKKQLIYDFRSLPIILSLYRSPHP